MATYEAECPKCRGNMWDNRATKRNPKQPDFKCKDRDCDGVIWPSKAPTRATPAPAANAKQAFSGGPHIKGLDPEPGEETDAVSPDERFDKMAELYTKCHVHATSCARDQFGVDTSDTAVAAMAATIFIQACGAGLHR